LNNRAFKLGKDAEHLKHDLAGRRGRVETLLMQKQVDAERVKFGQERHKVFQAAGVSSKALDQIPTAPDKLMSRARERMSEWVLRLVVQQRSKGAATTDVMCPLDGCT
jgi:hypothetical protein